MKKRIVCICLGLLCMMLFASCAVAPGEDMLTGVSYNPCTYEILDESFRVEITEDGESPIMSFSPFDEQVTVSLSQKQDDSIYAADEGVQYEGYFRSKEKEYYAWITAFDAPYVTGLIREMDREENFQIAFAVSADESIREQLKNALQDEHARTLSK